MGTHRKQPQRKATVRLDDLPELLFRCRTDRKLTLEQVAAAVSLSKKAISNIERRISTPMRVNRARIEEFLRKHGYFPKAA
jgi:transcriptional regulator with XRE-family HTH domain